HPPPLERGVYDGPEGDRDARVARRLRRRRRGDPRRGGVGSRDRPPGAIHDPRPPPRRGRRRAPPGTHPAARLKARQLLAELEDGGEEIAAVLVSGKHLIGGEAETARI